MAELGGVTGGLLNKAGRWALLVTLCAAVLVPASVGLNSLLQSRPANPIPADLEGEKLGAYLNALDKDGIAALQSYALGRLKRNALDSDAHYFLEIVAGLQKDKNRANDLTLNAARYTLRDPRLQLAAIGLALERKNFEEALFRIDANMRARPEQSSIFFPTLAQLSAANDSAAAIAKVLNQDPPWRASFIAFLYSQNGGWRNVYHLFSVLRAGGGSAKVEERQTLLKSLIQAGEYEQAYFVWLDSLTSTELPRVLNVYDGGFDLEPHDLFFDWTLRHYDNASIGVELRPGSATNRSLKLNFFGYKGPFAGVSQYLRLAPGDYEFSYESMVLSLQATRGLTWRLRCVDQREVLLEGPEIVEAAPWTPAHAQFKIPTQGCATQLLKLETKGQAVLDTALSGTIYFDDVAISPSGASNSAPGEN